MAIDTSTAVETHRLMDRAEDLARRTYAEQGLSELLGAVEAITEEGKLQEPEVALTPELARTPGSGAAPVNGMLWCVLVIGLGLGCALWSYARYSSESSSAPAARVPLSDIQAVEKVRVLASRATSDQLKGLLAGQPQTVLFQNKGAPAAYASETETVEDLADLRQRGALTSVDREGRPELTWSGVSGPICHLLVERLYEDGPVPELAVTIDGKDHGVSCTGSAHTIVFSPRL